ncbi:MAG: hypothetical protein QXT06_01335 [Candidatus Bathyarchaeia archaeon]|nr:hypothetical protein [Candidatus Bathyarchaeota archaeon]
MDRADNNVVKAEVKALDEITNGYLEVLNNFKDVIKEVKRTKKLWKDGNNSILMKLGIALIAFPDPTISDVLGGILLAAGAIQNGIKRQSLHVDDIPKTLQNVMKELMYIEERIH